MKEKLLLQLKRVVSVVATVGMIVTTITPAYAAPWSSVPVDTTTGDGMDITEAQLEQLETPESISNQYKNILEGAGAASTLSNSKLELIPVEDEETTVTADAGVMTTAAGPMRVTPDDIHTETPSDPESKPPVPTVSPGSGEVMGQIVKHSYTQTIDGITSTAMTQLVIGFVDNRAAANRATVTVQVLDESGNNVGTTTATWVSGSENVYYAYLSLKNGLWVGENKFTINVTSPKGTVRQNTTPYTIDTRNISNLALKDVDIAYGRFDAPNGGDTILAVFTYIANTKSKDPYTVKLYCDDQLIQTGQITPQAPMKQNMSIGGDRSSGAPAGKHTFRLEVNEGREVYENNYTDNTFTKEITVGSDRRPSINSTLSENTLQGGSNSDVKYNVYIQNHGVDAVTAPVNFVINGNVVHTVNVMVPGDSIYNQNITVPYDKVKAYMTEYKVGARFPNGATASINSYGTTISYRLGNSTTDYIDSPTAKLSATKQVDRFFYWYSETDVAIDMIQTVPSITPAANNRFRVVLTNNNPAVATTVHYVINTTGTSTVKAYESEAITIAGGQKVEQYVDVYCPNAAGTNFVVASLVESDNDNTNNSKSVSYSVGMDTGHIDVTGFTNTDTTSVPAGQLLKYESKWTILTYDQPGSVNKLPTSFSNCKLKWYVDGNLIATDTVTIIANTEQKFTRNLDTTNLSAGEHSCHTVLDTGYTSDGKTVGGTSKTSTFRVTSGTSIYVKDLKLGKSSYLNTEKVSYSFTVVNRTSKDISDMRIKVSIPGTSYVRTTTIQMGRMTEQDVSNSFSCSGQINGAAYSLLGNYSLRVEVNLDDEGNPIHGDDSVSDNVATTPLIVTDSFPFDIALEDVTLDNPRSVYSGQYMPEFSMKIRNYSSQSLAVILTAKSGSTQLYTQNLTLPQATMVGGSVNPSGFNLEGQPLNITNNGNYSIVWSVNIVSSSLAAKETNKANNSSKAFAIKVDTLKDISVSGLRAVPSTAYEDQTIEVYYTIKNTGPDKMEDIRLIYNAGLPPHLDSMDSPSGFGLWSIHQTYGPYYNKELRVKMQGYVPLSEPEGDTNFANFGANVPVTLSLKQLWTRDPITKNNAILENDSATIYINNYPRTDNQWVLPYSSCDGKVHFWEIPGSGGRYYTKNGKPLAFVGLNLKSYFPTRVLEWPDSKIKITFEGHPDWYSPACETGTLGTWYTNNMDTSVNKWPTFDNTFPFVYDGKEQDVTIVCEIDSGAGVPGAWHDGFKNYDTNLSNNVLKFKIHVPAFPRFCNFATANDMSHWSKNYNPRENLQVNVKWYDLQANPGTILYAHREIYVQGVKMWESDAGFENTTTVLDRHTFTPEQLKKKGVDLTGDILTIESRINWDRAVPEKVPAGEDASKLWTNNSSIGRVGISHPPFVDFETVELSTTSDLNIDAGTTVPVKIVFMNNSPYTVFTDSTNTTIADVDIVIKLNGKELIKQTIKKMGGITKPRTFNLNLPIPATASGPQTIEATINPKKLIAEDDWSNNSKYLTFMCEEVGEQIDMAVWANPANYNAMVNDPVKTISFHAEMQKNMPNPYTDYNTQADLYMNGTFVKRFPITWNTNGEADINYTVPADLMKSQNYTTFELRINPDKAYEEIDYENNSAFAGLLVKEPDKPDDYAVKNASMTYDGYRTIKIQATFSNAAKVDTPELLCEWDIFNATTGSWQSLWNTKQNLSAWHGITYTQSLGIAPEWIDSTGKIKARARINNDRKYTETDFSNNVAEVSVVVDNTKDVSAEWIKAVSKEEYDNFSEIIKAGGEFHAVSRVMPDDAVYLVACYKNNNKFSAAGPCTFTLSATTTNGKVANNMSTNGNIASLNIDSKTYVKAAYTVTSEDVLTLATEISMAGDQVPGNNRATSSLPVVMDKVKNLTADSIWFENVYTKSTKAISAGDRVKIMASYRNDMFDFDSHEWAIYVQDKKGHRELVADSSAMADTSFPHNSTLELSFEYPEWDFYNMDKDAELVLVLDPNNKIDETDETDNSCSVPFTFYSRFNIEISIDKFERNLDKDQSVEIPIKMDYSGVTDDQLVTINMYLNDVLVDTRKEAAMSSGYMYYTKRMTDKGDFTFRVEVNPEDDRTVVETQYNDNIAQVTFSVSGDPNIKIPAEFTPHDGVGGLPALGGRVHAKDISVNSTAIRGFSTMIVRWRNQNASEMTEDWHYDFYHEGAGGDIIGFSHNINIDSDRIDLYGRNIYQLEVNPIIPASEVAQLKNEASLAGIALNITAGKRQYEEVDYSDNMTTGYYTIKENPDYVGGFTWLCTNNGGKTEGVLDMEIENNYDTGIQLDQYKTYGLQSNMGVRSGTMGLYTVYSDVPYKIVHTKPDGTTETVTKSNYEFKYTDVTKYPDGGFGYRAAWDYAMTIVDTVNPGWHTYTITVNDQFAKPELASYRGNNVRTFRYFCKGEVINKNLKATKLELLKPNPASPDAKPVFRLWVEQTGSELFNYPNPANAYDDTYEDNSFAVALINLDKTSYAEWNQPIQGAYQQDVRGALWFTCTQFAGGSGKQFYVDLDVEKYESATNFNYTKMFDDPNYSVWFDQDYPLEGGTVHYAAIINPKWIKLTDGAGIKFDSVKKESSYDDNYAFLDVTWPADKIDLVAKSVNVTGQAVSAEDVEVLGIVENTAKRVGVTGVDVEFWVNDELWHTENVDLPMGQNTEVKFTDKLPRCRGNTKLEMRVNTNSACVETNYNNNRVDNTINVLGPQLDLVAVSVVPDGTLKKRNGAIKLTVSVKNTRDGVTNPHDVKDINVVLWDANGNQLYRTLIPEIKAGETVTSLISTFVPGSAPYGPMDWIMEVNPESIGSSDFKDELRFDNNTATTRITVDPPRNFMIPEGEIENDIVPEGDPVVVDVKITSIDPTRPYRPEVIVKVDGVEVSRDTVDVTPGGEVPFHKELPDVPLGEHTIEVIVNPDKTLPEDDYTDNVWTGSATVKQGKDLAVTLDTTATVVSEGKNFSVVATFRNNGNKSAENAPYYISYRGSKVATGVVTLAGKESKNVPVSIPAGSILGFQEIEAGINVEKMIDEEYDISNNVTYLNIRVRDHNTKGTIDNIPLDPDDPVVIEKDPTEEKLDEIIKADDPTSIITKVEFPDIPGHPEWTPDDPEHPLDWPIGPGEEIRIIITITTDDGEESTEYEVIIRRPKDDVDADAYVVAGGTKYPAVRTDDVFVITLPASASGGVLNLEAIEPGSYISEVEGDPVHDSVVAVTDLGELYANREMTVYFTGTSASGLHEKDFTVKITIANTPPTISITNATELNGAVYNKTYGKKLGNIKFPYGPGITAVAEAIDANKTHGIVVEVLGEDVDPDQFIYAKITFQGKEYPITWDDYGGPVTADSGAGVRGFAYIPSTDLGGNAKRIPLKGYIYDNLIASTEGYLAIGESTPVYIDVDNFGPECDVDYDPENKIIVVENIRDNNVGQYQVIIRAKPSTVSSWGTPRTEDVHFIDRVVFQYPELSGDVDVEITVTDHLLNKTVIKDTLHFNSDGTSIDLEGVYAKNSRKAVSLFINVRYRGAEKVDLLGFSFIGS